MRSRWMRTSTLLILATVLAFQAGAVENWTIVEDSKPVVTGLPNGEKEVVSSLGDGFNMIRSLADILGDEVWRRQEDMTDALFRAIGDFSVNFDVIDAGDFNLGLSVSPARKLFYVNSPLERVALPTPEGPSSVLKINSDQPSKYVLLNSLETKFDLGLDLIDDLGGLDVASLKVAATGGLGFYHIENRPSPRDLPSMVPDVNPLIGSDAELEMAAIRKSGVFKKIGKFAGKLFDDLEGSLGKLMSSLSDEDSTEVFVDGLFSPVRLPFKLPMDVRMVQEKLKVGEIFTSSVFGGGGPGIEMSEGIFSTSASRFYRMAYQVTVLKLDENRILVRPKISVRKGFNFHPLEAKLGLSLGILRLSFIPFYWRYEGADAHSLETVLELDLRDQAVRDAFDGLMTLNLLEVKKLIMNKNPNLKVSKRVLEDAKINRRDVKLNLGLVKMVRSKSREVIKRTTVADGVPNSVDWSGEVAVNSYTMLSSLAKRYVVDKKMRTLVTSDWDETQKQIGEAELSPETISSSEPMSVINWTHFSDNHATLSDLSRMLEYARLMVGSEVSLLPEKIQSEIQSYYEQPRRTFFEKLGLKKVNTRQAVTVMTKIPEAVLTKFLATVTEDRLWTLMANVILEDPNQVIAFKGSQGLSWLRAQDRASLEIVGSSLKWGACPVTAAYKGRETVISCRGAFLEAKYLASAFSKITKASTEEKKLQWFTKVVASNGISPLLNQLILRAYKEATGQAAPISYAFRFQPGAGIKISDHSARQGETIRTDVFLRKYGIGEIAGIQNSERRLKDGELFFDRSRPQGPLFLSFESPVYLTPDQKLTIWLMKTRFVLKDAHLVVSEAEGLVPQAAGEHNGDSLFRYEVELSPEFVSAMEGAGNYEVQIRVENAKNQPLSELGRFLVRNIRK